MQIQPSMLVACLCANWCGTCTGYKATFFELQSEFPELEFRWIDIEDEAELVDEVDVENFPTILLARSGHTLFFGTVLPRIENLRRLIQTQLQAHPAKAGPVPAQVQALTARLSGPR